MFSNVPARGHRYVGGPTLSDRHTRRHFGSDTSSKTTTSSEFPPEFRPLAEGAVRQLLELQKVLPIAAFAEFEPAGTAGIAPMQQFAMDQLIPATFRTTEAQQGVFNTQAPVNLTSFGAADAGRSSNAAQSALDSLRNSGRLGGGSVALPGGQLQDAFASFLPPVQNPSTVFPGLTAENIAQFFPQAARGSVPVLSGPGPTQIDPGNPTPEGFFPPPFESGVDTDLIVMKAQLTNAELREFNRLVAGGMPPDQAFKLTHGKSSFGEKPKPKPTPPPEVDLNTGSA